MLKTNASFQPEPTYSGRFSVVI